VQAEALEVSDPDLERLHRLLIAREALLEGDCDGLRVARGVERLGELPGVEELLRDEEGILRRPHVRLGEAHHGDEALRVRDGLLRVAGAERSDDATTAALRRRRLHVDPLGPPSDAVQTWGCLRQADGLGIDGAVAVKAL